MSYSHMRNGIYLKKCDGKCAIKRPSIWISIHSAWHMTSAFARALALLLSSISSIEISGRYLQLARKAIPRAVICMRCGICDWLGDLSPSPDFTTGTSNANPPVQAKKLCVILQGCNRPAPNWCVESCSWIVLWRILAELHCRQAVKTTSSGA